MPQAILRPGWEILTAVPMPWRFTLIALGSLIILSWLAFRGLPWMVAKLSFVVFVCAELLANGLLLGEYVITQHVRKNRSSSLPRIIYIFDDLLGDAVRVFLELKHVITIIASIITKKRWYPPNSLLVFLGCMITLLWYLRPLIGVNIVSQSIQEGEVFWYSLEGWILKGQWKPSAKSFSPEDFIHSYFLALNNHEYLRAWNMTTNKFKGNKNLMQNGYTDYLSFWRDKVKYVTIANVKLWTKGINTATIDVRWQYSMRNNKTPGEAIRFSLIWDIKSNTWLIDETKKL